MLLSLDEKKVKTLKEDLLLVTETAKILAVKMKKVSEAVNELISEISTMESPASGTRTAAQPVEIKKAKYVEEVVPQQRVVSQPATPTPQPTPQVQPAKQASQDIVTFQENKVLAILDIFSEKIKTITVGSEIASVLLNLRDECMAAATKHSTAFSEMGRLASRYKNTRELSTEERSDLIEKIHDWKNRLGYDS